MNSDIPEGWTDDMTISILSGQSHQDVADWILDEIVRRDPQAIARDLIGKFGVSEEDAYLALDRAQGGLVRAMTGNPKNAPDPRKDPIARRTFDIAWNSFPREGWLSRKRKPAGKWLVWYESRS